MELTTIDYQKEEGLALVALNRPEIMNALSTELITDLDRALDNIEEDEDIGAVILTGQEEFFGVGADLNEVVKIRTPLEAHDFTNRIRRFFQRLEDLEKPVICAISGLALGGGLELTLVCDLRIAGDNAMFGLPEITIGVLPAGGGTQRLPRLIGTGRAKELLYAGDPIDAHEAYRIGLVNKVVPAASLLDEAKKLAHKLKKRPAAAFRMIKMAVNHGMNMDLQSGLVHEARCFELLFSTEDQKEGIQSFIEKKKPVFKGK